jgi:hypothetical protein
VEVEIVPEPEPRERDVVLRGLADLGGELDSPAAYRSPWRLAALEPPDDGYWDTTARRLKSPGASRA